MLLGASTTAAKSTQANLLGRSSSSPRGALLSYILGSATSRFAAGCPGANLYRGRLYRYRPWVETDLAALDRDVCLVLCVLSGYGRLRPADGCAYPATPVPTTAYTSQAALLCADAKPDAISAYREGVAWQDLATRPPPRAFRHRADEAFIDAYDLSSPARPGSPGLSRPLPSPAGGQAAQPPWRTRAHTMLGNPKAIDPYLKLSELQRRPRATARLIIMGEYQRRPSAWCGGAELRIWPRCATC